MLTLGHWRNWVVNTSFDSSTHQGNRVCLLSYMTVSNINASTRLLLCLFRAILVHQRLPKFLLHQGSLVYYGDTQQNCACMGALSQDRTFSVTIHTSQLLAYPWCRFGPCQPMLSWRCAQHMRNRTGIAQGRDHSQWRPEMCSWEQHKD